MRVASGVVIGFISCGLVGCNPSSTPATTGATTSGSNPAAAGPSSGSLTALKVDNLKVGTGPGAKDGDQLTMQYKGSLADGSVFDTNMKPDGKPFKFILGAGSVIKGWDQGLVGMKVGGERKLSIPASLGYGAQAQGGKIPPNSDLFFDVKLQKIASKDDVGKVLLSDKKVGTGASLKAGDKVQITYVSTDEDGNVIDARNQTTPFKFKVGNGDVLPVIDQGVVGMKTGGERILTVPAEYLRPGPQIHPGMTIQIDIHLVKIGS